MHNSISYMFISILYMFRAPMCSSSWESIEWILVRHLIYVIPYKWSSGVQVWMELHGVPSIPAHQTVTYIEWHISDVVRVFIKLILKMMSTWMVETCKKGKAIPLQAWTGPEGSRKLRLPDFKKIGTWRW